MPLKTTLICLFVLSVGSLMAADWPSFGRDPQRTSWSPQETDINPGNAGAMTLLWKTHLDNQPRELNGLTAAVAVEWVVTDQGMKEIVVVGGASDNLFALATVYAIASDGKLHVLNITDGEERIVPIQFVPPFSKNWSLNLAGNVLYTSTSQDCNGARSGVYAMDLNTHKISFFQASKGGAGIWGRAGVAVSVGGMVFAGTGDGMYDAAKGNFPDTILQLSAKDLQLVDYFTPVNHNYLTRKDLDMGSLSSSVFSWKGREIVATGGKEGIVYLLDAKQIGGGDHKTPLFRSALFANEGADFAGKGFWGAFATAEDDKNNRWLFAPASGAAASGVKFPMTNGDAPNGSIMAFRIEEKDSKPAVEPGWISRDMNLPEPPIVAGGLVFAISNGEFARQSKGDGALFTSAERIAKHAGNTVLYAFDATTGKQLYSSGDIMPSFTHFSGISIASGRVYVTTFDSTVYAFGLKQ